MKEHRLSPQDERALRWYFTQAAADVFRLRGQSYEPGIVTSDAADWRAIESAHAGILRLDSWWRLTERLAQLTTRQYLALKGYYGRAGHVPLEHVGTLTESYERWVQNGGQTRRPNKKIDDEAEALLSSACAAFGRAEGKDRDRPVVHEAAVEARRQAPHRCRASRVYECPCGAG